MSLDLVEPETFLVVGRPFGMLEGANGRVELTSIFDGEVVDINHELLHKPELVADSDPTVSWMVEIDGFVQDEPDESQWDSLQFLSAEPLDS